MYIQHYWTLLGFNFNTHSQQNLCSKRSASLQPISKFIGCTERMYGSLEGSCSVDIEKAYIPRSLDQNINDQKVSRMKNVIWSVMIAFILYSTLFHFVNSPPSLTSSSIQSTDGMQLIVLRHALSSWDVPNRTADFDRPLQEKGFQEGAAMGKYLRSKHVPLPDLVVASPSLRTKQTFNAVITNWVDGWSESSSPFPVTWDQRLYDLDNAEGYLSIARGLNQSYHRVMFVGHNPAAWQVSLKLLGDRAPAALRTGFPTDGFCEMYWSQNMLNKMSSRDSGWERISFGTAALRTFLYPEKIGFVYQNPNATNSKQSDGLA